MELPVTGRSSTSNWKLHAESRDSSSKFSMLVFTVRLDISTVLRLFKSYDETVLGMKNVHL